MSYTDEETRIQLRAERIAGWLKVLDEMYEGLISQTEETASVPGFDDASRRRPCEHKTRWMQGGLCLRCDNTGWRKIERGEEGVDPYATEVKVGVRVVESTSARKAREAQRIDSIITGLQRNVRIRAGAEGVEGPAERNLRLVANKGDTLERILRTVYRLRETGPRPETIEKLTELGLAFDASDPEDVVLLAAEVPGPIREAS